MENKQVDEGARAKDYAFLLLRFRPRSEKEISQRLTQKKFTNHSIRETIAFLKTSGLLNDRAFAEAWIESRLKKPFGLGRIIRELKAKGIEDKIIDACIEEARKNYSEEKVVFEMARDTYQRLKGIEPERAKRRLYAYLLRRGFPPEAVIEALAQLT